MDSFVKKSASVQNLGQNSYGQFCQEVSSSAEVWTKQLWTVLSRSQLQCRSLDKTVMDSFVKKSASVQNLGQNSYGQFCQEAAPV